MSSFHFHQELPSWAQAVLNWALLASFIIQLCSIVLNCTHLCSIVLNCLNCAQLCSIVLNCAQLCSTVHNCAQLCSTVLKCAQLGLILLNLAFLRIWWTTTTTTKVFSWSASLCERLKITQFLSFFQCYLDGYPRACNLCDTYLSTTTSEFSECKHPFYLPYTQHQKQFLKFLRKKYEKKCMKQVYFGSVANFSYF